jgi:hypothetical protein
MKPDAPVQHDDATAREHYGDVPDPKATHDPSSPQSSFWQPEDQDRVAAEIAEAPLEEEPQEDADPKPQRPASRDQATHGPEDRHGEKRATM